MPGRPKNFDRIKEAHESSSNPTKATRGGRIMTCSNYKQPVHNICTCTRPTAVETGPKRKREKPKKNKDDTPDPWSIENAPRRRRSAQSQSTPGGSSTQNAIDPHPSTDPPASTAPPASASRGRGRGRGGGRELPIPRGYGCYISPFIGRIFEVWGSTATNVNVPTPQPPQDP